MGTWEEAGESLCWHQLYLVSWSSMPGSPQPPFVSGGLTSPAAL